MSTVVAEKPKVKKTDVVVPQVISAMTEGERYSAIVSRAMSDPAVDMDKLERLCALMEKATERDKEAAFNASLRTAQSLMGPISADATNPQTKSKYATYAKLDGVLRPIYTNEGFSLSFNTEQSPLPDHVRVLAYVSHSAGHTRTYKVDMPNDGKGAKGGDVMTKTHAQGAAHSYGMRYLLKMIFNVAVGEEDKDGNVPKQSISPEQAEQIKNAIVDADADISRFCRFFKVEKIEDLPAASFGKAMEALEKKKARS